MRRTIISVGIAAALVTSIAGCAQTTTSSPMQSSPPQPTQAPSPAEIVTTSTPSTASTQPDLPPAGTISNSGVISLADPAGYSATITYDLTVSNFRKSIANDAPGFASVTYDLSEQGTVINTTPGRNNPGVFKWSPTLLYPIDSIVCTTTKDTVDKQPKISQGEATVPRFFTGNPPSSAYCALPLAGLTKYGPNNPMGSSLSSNGTAPLTPPSGQDTPTGGDISGVPESAVDALVTGLATPAKVVFDVTGSSNTAASGNNNEFVPSGEHCTASVSWNPKSDAPTSIPLSVFVPTKYKGLCPAA